MLRIPRRILPAGAPRVHQFVRMVGAFLPGIIAAGCRKHAEPADMPPSAMIASGAGAVSSLQTDGCMADTVKMNPAPRPLVDAYLEHGGNGDFLHMETWSASAVECPARSPGLDEAILVTDWSVTPLKEHPDSAWYEVVFQRIGRVGAGDVGGYIDINRGEERDTIIAVHKPYGWRIGGFEFKSHVLPAAIKRLVAFRTRESEFLDSLVAAGARTPRSND